MYVLGLSSLADAAAALLADGTPVAAAEEERFTRVKHQEGSPGQAIAYCLDEAGITLRNVAHIGLFWKPWVVRRKVEQTIKSLVLSRAMFHQRVQTGVSSVSNGYLSMLSLPRRLRRQFGPSDFRFHFLDHHLCHAASAFYVSPFERAAILTMDGTGEDTTTLFARGEGSEISEL